MKVNHTYVLDGGAAGPMSIHSLVVLAFMVLNLENPTKLKLDTGSLSLIGEKES